jgi:hypothetical protein
MDDPQSFSLEEKLVGINAKIAPYPAPCFCPVRGAAE